MIGDRVSRQYAVRYVNHRKDDKVVTLGNYDAEFDTADIVRDLREQGYEPQVISRTVTVIYTDWQEVAS